MRKAEKESEMGMEYEAGCQEQWENQGSKGTAKMQWWWYQDQDVQRVWRRPEYQAAVCSANTLPWSGHTYELSAMIHAHPWLAYSVRSIGIREYAYELARPN